jgi:alkylation response protein AidB-like acyl-CoA dehydrogenase
VRCEDVFVPSHRTLATVAALQGRYASEANRDRPLFRTAFFPFVLVASMGAPVGMAQAAMDVFLERLPGRTITYTHYADQAQAPVTHLQVAEAAARTHAAELLARDLSRRLDEAAGEGRELTVAERAQIRGEAALVVRECRTAVEILADASGASSIQTAVPIQRICRDIRALSIHAALNWTTNLEVHGRVLVGADPQTPFL